MSGRRTSRSFVGELACVRHARQFVRDQLEAADEREAIDAAVLLTSELAANVVRHACTSLDVVVDIDGPVVRIEIHDSLAVTEAFRDRVTQPPRTVEPTMTGGRGWLLVGATALTFGLDDKGPAGKAVWFESASSDVGTPVPNRQTSVS